jgi:hypothetical protein
MTVEFCEPYQAFREIIRLDYPKRGSERIAAKPEGSDGEMHSRMSISFRQAEAFRDGLRHLNREDLTTSGLPLWGLPRNRASPDG